MKMIKSIQKMKRCNQESYMRLVEIILQEKQSKIIIFFAQFQNQIIFLFRYQQMMEVVSKDNEDFSNSAADKQKQVSIDMKLISLAQGS